MEMNEILSTSKSRYPAANRTHCAKSKQQFPSHRQALAKISMSVTVVLIKIHAWHCIIILLRVSAWCDVGDVKIFKADFKFDICIECVPLLFSSFGARFLSKTVAAFPFDLDRKIHLLYFGAGASETHHSRAEIYSNAFVMLLIFVCGCRCVFRRVVFMYDAHRINIWKISVQNVFPSDLTPSLTLHVNMKCCTALWYNRNGRFRCDKSRKLRVLLTDPVEFDHCHSDSLLIAQEQREFVQVIASMGSIIEFYLPSIRIWRHETRVLT